MPRVPDQQDLQVISGKPAGLMVHLGNQWAGRINRLEAAVLRLLLDGWRHAMCREDHSRALRDLVQLCDEDGTTLLQLFDDMAVVHDLLAHVDRRSVPLQRLLNGDASTICRRRLCFDGLETIAGPLSVTRSV